METVKVRVTLRVPIELVTPALGTGREIEQLRAFLNGCLAEYGIEVTQSWLDRKGLAAAVARLQKGDK